MPFVLSSCGSSSSAARGTLRLPIDGDSGIPDPAQASSPSATFLAGLLYTGLVKLTPDLHVVPDLAVSMPTISNDGRTYTFTVQQGIHFADGRAVTARDVAYSFTRALRPGIGSPLARHYLGGIVGAPAVEDGTAYRLRGVRVLHRLTVRIRLRRPDASFIEKLAFPPAAVVEPGTIQAARAGASAGHPAGTGPWEVVARQRDGTWVLEPRPHYYDGPLALRRLLLVPVDTGAHALDLYRKGVLDAVRVPNDRYDQLASHADFRHSQSLDAFYAAPLTPHTDLAAGLDRGRLSSALPGQMSPLSSIVPPAIPDYEAASPSIDPAPGGPSKLPSVRLQLDSPGDPDEIAIRRALSRQWRLTSGDGVPLRLVHAYHALPDPGVWLHGMLPYTDSRWYRRMLVANAILTNDPVDRMSTYGTMESWALQRGIIVPLASGSLAFLVKPRVQGLQVTPVGLMPEDDSWSSVSVNP